MDSVGRTVADNFWFASERIKRWAKNDPRRIYYLTVYLIYGVAVIIMVLSTVFKIARPYELAATGAVLGLFALMIAPILQLIVSNRILPKPLRPGIVSNIIMIIGAVFYGFLITAMCLQMFAGITI